MPHVAECLLSLCNVKRDPREVRGRVFFINIPNSQPCECCLKRFYAKVQMWCNIVCVCACVCVHKLGCAAVMKKMFSMFLGNLLDFVA